MEELRVYCEIPNNIDLKLMDKPDESTLGGEHNDVQSDLEEIALGEPRESTPIPPLLQMVLHPSQSEGYSGNAKLGLSGRKRSLPPDRILLNSYLPHRGPASVMEEVTAPGPDDVKLILHRWRPFNLGESTVDRLDDLYPRML